jgi:hypothetical protein
MCKLVCEKYCKPLVRDGKPWRLFSDFPTKLEEPDRPGFVKIFRGIHDVIVPNLEHPGSWWSFSPTADAQECSSVPASRNSAPAAVVAVFASTTILGA